MAAVGAVSVIDNCDNASFTVLAVVHTCWVSCPSTEMSSGRERFRTMVSPSRTESCLAGRHRHGRTVRIRSPRGPRTPAISRS